MSLQQRYQRLGRNDSWSASLRDTVLLVFSLPVALGLAGMLIASKELSPEQQAAQAARQARRATLTATRLAPVYNTGDDQQPRARYTGNTAAPFTTETELETEAEAVADQPTTHTKTTRRTVW
jgi:hypothetical protein